MKTKETIETFGSIKEVALTLGLTVQAIYAWGDEVPPLRAYQIRDILAARKLGAGETAPDQLAA